MEGPQQSPLALIFVFLAVWIAAFAIYGRYWRRTKTGQEWNEFNRRLNRAVRRRAASIHWLTLIVLGVVVMLAAERFRRFFHANEAPGDASALAVALIVVSSYIIALFPAAMLTNLIWWFTPSMREASIAARIGLDSVSFRCATLLQAMQAAIVMPICLAQIYLGSVMR